MKSICFLCTLCCLLVVCTLKSLQSSSIHKQAFPETEQVLANRAERPVLRKTNDIQLLCCIVAKSALFYEEYRILFHYPVINTVFICAGEKSKKLLNSYVDSIIFPETGNLFQAKQAGVISQELLLFKNMQQFAIHQVMATFSQQYKSKLYAVVPLPVFRTYRLNKDARITIMGCQNIVAANTCGNILPNIRDTLEEEHTSLYDAAPHFRKNRQAMNNKDSAVSWYCFGIHCHEGAVMAAAFSMLKKAYRTLPVNYDSVKFLFRYDKSNTLK